MGSDSYYSSSRKRIKQGEQGEDRNQWMKRSNFLNAVYWSIILSQNIFKLLSSLHMTCNVFPTILLNDIQIANHLSHYSQFFGTDIFQTFSIFVLSGEEKNLGRKTENVKKIPSAICKSWKKMHCFNIGRKADFLILTFESCGKKNGCSLKLVTKQAFHSQGFEALL